MDPIIVYALAVAVVAGVLTWFVYTHSEPYLSDAKKKKNRKSSSENQDGF